MSAPFSAKVLRFLCNLWIGGFICSMVLFVGWTIWLLVSPSILGKRPTISEAVKVAIGSPGGNLMPITLPAGNSSIPVTAAAGNNKLIVSPWLWEASGEMHFETSELRIQILFLLGKRLVVVVLGLLILFMTRQFVVDAMEGNPFTFDNAQRLRWIGWILLGASLVKPVWDSLICQWVLSMAGVQSPALSPWMDFGFSVALFLFACFVLILSAVFRHGVELEQEHATTV